MKKRIKGRKLSRGQGARRALFRSLIRALIVYGRIVTTKAKAKTVQKQVDKLVNLAKKDSVAKKRRVYAILGNDRRTSDYLFNKIAPIFKDRVGGYTRILYLPRRRGDAAEMARLEWVKEIRLSVEDKSDKSKKKKTKEDKGKKPAILRALRGKGTKGKSDKKQGTAETRKV